MSNRGTALSVGQFAELCGAVIRNLPRDIDSGIAEGWCNNGAALHKVLRQALTPPEDRIGPIGMSESTAYLRRLYEGEYIVLDPTDGKRTIVEATDVFTGYIDLAFKSFGLDVPALPTVETEFAVYEQIADGTFVQNFDSLGRPRTELCSTPHQVVEFAVKHRARLCGEGCGNFFLIHRADGEFFVAGVNVSTDGRLDVSIIPFTNVSVGDAKYHHRLVVPQLVPLAT